MAGFENNGDKNRCKTSCIIPPMLDDRGTGSQHRLLEYPLNVEYIMRSTSKNEDAY